ncbi:hypothetical protein DPMN_077722 [Dreissena polymorpha]|uniref:Reverse transcriptase domain-containing protein n=1 Tax=Dreissena polymorpha TaxID=45954 RepID=A0A9D3YPT8_DREPO|nr:hypothetical protein DPMN_077722 [Dreissena polymorpha]
MMAYGMLSEDSTLKKGWCKSFNNSTEKPVFRTSMGVRQGGLLSPVLLKLFFKKLTQETLDDHHISIC